MDIATSAWGPYAGDLIVGSENSGTVRLINPTTHAVTTIGSVGSFPGAETISAIPLSLNGGDPLQGFYVPITRTTYSSPPPTNSSRKVCWETSLLQMNSGVTLLGMCTTTLALAPSSSRHSRSPVTQSASSRTASL